MALALATKGEEVLLLNRIEIYPEWRKQGLLVKALNYLSSLYPDSRLSLIPYPLQHLKNKGDNFTSDSKKLKEYYQSLGFNETFKEFLIK